MKKIIMTALILSLCLAVTGCSGKNPVTGYKSGDVTLGQYKELQYTPASEEVTDEAVENKINSDLQSHAELKEVTDRTVQNGDTVNIDYVGKIDGVAFENGTGNAPSLKIGSGQMIPGFEDGIIGFNKGETKTINVTFPESYPQNPEMAGVAATFDITVNSISESVVPELTDAFANEKLGHATVDEYRAAVRSELEANAKNQAVQQKESDLIEAAVKNATFNKDLTSEIEEAKGILLNNLNARMQSMYNVDARTFFTGVYGMSDENFNSLLQSQAEADIKMNYLLSAIVDTEKIDATKEEVEEFGKSVMSSYGVNNLDALYNLVKTDKADGKAVVTEQVKMNKARDLIINSAVKAE